MSAGLRGRPIGRALVVTSLATLTAAALDFAPLLERRARERPAARAARPVRTMRPELRTTRPTDGPRRPARRRRPPERRAGGRIVDLDERGHALADTAPADPPAPGLADLRAERDEAAARTGPRWSPARTGGVAYAATVVRADERLTLVIAKRLDDTRAAACGGARRAAASADRRAARSRRCSRVLLSRSLLRRLRRLRGRARGAGRRGSTTRWRSRVDDEVAVVARALEEMRGRLVAGRGGASGVRRDGSHELRTPLASLQATLELLREETLRGDATAADASTARTDTALRQTHRLVGLAADLLDLSRVDGDAPLAAEPLELAEVAAAIAREFAARLAAPGGAGRGVPARRRRSPTPAPWRASSRSCSTTPTTTAPGRSASRSRAQPAGGAVGGRATRGQA